MEAPPPDEVIGRDTSRPHAPAGNLAGAATAAAEPRPRCAPVMPPFSPCIPSTVRPAAAWRGLALQPRLANAWRLEGGKPTRVRASCRRGWSSLEPAQRPPPWAAHRRSGTPHRRMSPEVARTLGLRVVELLAAVWAVYEPAVMLANSSRYTSRPYRCLSLSCRTEPTRHAHALILADSSCPRSPLRMSLAKLQAILSRCDSTTS